MFSFYTPKIFKTFCLVLLSIFFLQVSVLGQATFRITKPVIGTTQICSSNNTNYYNNLSYGFSSNVVNSSGNVPYHFVELSNENGLIQPREIGCFSPYVNVVYVGAIDINGQNLPPGGGYRIRVFSKSPSVYSEYSETFTILSSPTRPTLNISGSINLCSGTSQTLTVTNPDNNVSYQWQNNSSNITNATSTSHSVSTYGYYSVKAISENGCSIASNSVSVSLPYPLRGELRGYINNNYSYGGVIFSKSNQPFRLTASFSEGKSPYNFTLSDGTSNTVETNINYSKEYNLTTPASDSKTYTITTLTDACGSQVNNSATLKVRINDSKYCSVLGSGTSGIKSFSIQGTTINNINSGKAQDGWGEYLTPANINANVNYNFTIENNGVVQRYFAIWADLNQNGAFDTGERIFPMGANSSAQSITNSFTGVLKLPASTFNGQTRLRVYLSSDSYSPVSYPCNGAYDGEVEDYTLNVFNGVIPTVISTDSLPASGACIGSTFPVSFQVTGTSLPANTVFRVEGSYYPEFSNVINLGTTTGSSTNVRLPSNYSSNMPIYVRTVPVGTFASIIVKNSPNQLVWKSIPASSIHSTFNSNYNNSIFWGAEKSLSVSNTTPMAVFGWVSTANPPVSIELSDGRVFTYRNTGTNRITIDSNFVTSGIRKYKIVRTTDALCSSVLTDSTIIEGGNPYLKALQVSRYYNDTTSISKLCGSFYVKFAGKYFDTTAYRFYHVQISDANGSFDNPQDIGHVCLYKVLSESQGGQYISCYIPSTFPAGTGYRLRIIEKGFNITSPIYSTIFTVESPAFTFTSNLSRGVINEGEVTALNVNFTGGSPPFTVYLDGQYYTSTGNSNSIVVNLGPLHGRKYAISPSTSCGGYSNSATPLYLNVRTFDKDNTQWYIKPIQNHIYTDVLKNLYLINNSDTLIKKLPNDIYNSTIVNGYYDYNSLALQKSASVLRAGENYSLAQIDNRASTLLNNLLTGVWIDANQDGDFDDEGEELTKNQFAQSWNTSQTQSFTVPNSINNGFSRLRVRVVAKQYDVEPFDFNAANPIDKMGNTYDFPIVVLSNSVSSILSTPKITGNTLCNGNSFKVDFSKYGFASGANVIVQLSDASGNFLANPTIIGQGTTSSITATLPLETTLGNYRVRLFSNGIISPVSSSFNVTANQLISMVDGDWHAGSTWSCGRIPTFVDATTVAQGTTVTVFSGDARVGSIITNGVLSFLNGTTLRFNQP
ncbi:MAG: GEVED domain-containing protein [Arcicella sp.]|jgi:hypothetical protein|nr:GEVED domain-containing protein [Arcicella sp.]